MEQPTRNFTLAKSKRKRQNPKYIKRLLRTSIWQNYKNTCLQQSNNKQITATNTLCVLDNSSTHATFNLPVELHNQSKSPLHKQSFSINSCVNNTSNLVNPVESHSQTIGNDVTTFNSQPSQPTESLVNNVTSPVFDLLDTKSKCSSVDGKMLSLSDQLADWAIKSCLSRGNFNNLLNILKAQNDIMDFKTLPSDCRTLMKCNQKNCIVITESGSYYHFGIAKGVSYILEHYNLHPSGPVILLDINIDGLPLTKSSGSQFWPIMGSITDLSNEPFVIGIWHGIHKPRSPHELLSDFIAEYLELKINLFSYNDQNFSIQISKIICDAPAKSFILCVKGHNSYFGCTKCITEGNYINRRVCYNDLSSPLRTDANFRINAYSDDYQTGASPLLNLDLDLVNDIPLDYMHLVCLGVVKRLIRFWYRGNISIRLNSVDLELLNNSLTEFRSSISSHDFSRLPRPITEYERWKATEFRQFLLYSGPLLLKDRLKPSQYLHFLSLHCAIRILITPHLCIEYNDFSKQLLIYFVKNYAKLYGEEYVTHNVHNLIHLPDDVMKFGCLDKFSAFKFENYMSVIKRKVKTSNKPLQQYVNRIQESRLHELHVSVNTQSLLKPLLEYNEPLLQNKSVRSYKYIILNSKFRVGANVKNNHCILQSRAMPYSVITFIEDKIEYVSACPTSWLDAKNSRCLWPTNTKIARKAINLNMQPDKDWKTLIVLRIYGQYGSLNEALAVEKKKQNSSSSESEVAQEKRKIKKNMKYRESSLSPPPSMDIQKKLAVKEVEENRQLPVDDTEISKNEGSLNVALAVEKKKQKSSLSESEVVQEKRKVTKNMKYRDLCLSPSPSMDIQKKQAFKEVAENRQLPVDDTENCENKEQHDIIGDTETRSLNSSCSPISANVVASPTISNSSLPYNYEITDPERVSPPTRTMSNKSAKSNSSSDYDYMITTLNELKTLALYTVRKVELIEKQLGSGMTAKDSAGKMIMDCLPIKDLVGLQHLEEEIKKSETLKVQLLQFLKYSGGATSKDCINRCLEKTFTNNVAQACSWTGRKNNFRLSNLNLMYIIKDAVKENFPNATDEQYEKVVMMWFQHACTRIKRGKN